MQELVSSETLNNEEEIIVFEENLKGPKGENGATFTPNVSKTGNLSWTNDKNLENPETVNIRGPQGPQGIQGPQGLQGNKGEKGDDGYTPVKGTDYFTEADKQEFIEAVTEDASSNFVQTVSEKTTEFNNNATSKTNAFNSNATSKETAYNDNATAKIAEYDEHIEDLDNIVSKNTVSGESIMVDDALAYKIFGTKIDGNAEQVTTTGKNYFNAYAIKNTSIVIEDDGQSIKMPVVTSGNGVQSTNSTLAELCPHLNVGDQVILRFNRNLGNTKNNFIYLNSPIAETWNVGTSKTITEEMLECIVQLYGNRYTDGETSQCIITDFTIMKTSETNTDFEQFTNNEPSPNPDYPQSITTVKNSVKIKQVGRNLLSKKLNEYSKTTDNITVDEASDNLLKLSVSSESTAYENVQILSIQVQSGKTYTLSAKIDGKNNSSIRVVKGNSGASADNLGSAKNGQPLTFTCDGTYSYVGLFFYVSQGTKPSSDMTAIFSSVQLEEGTVSTDYEEYKSNEYDIDLQDNELVKLSDDIKDTIEIDKNGNVSLNKRIGKVVLDENTNPTIASQNYQGLFFFSLSALNMNVNSLKAISDYFTFVDDVRITDNASANTYLSYGQFGFRHGTTDRIYFKIADITTGTDFKAWLAEHNVTVYYELAELTTTSLGQLANFKTYAGINHFFLEANLATNFEIRYAQDLQKVISKQQEEIDELKTLLSSTATSALLLDNYANDLMEEV